MWFRFSYDADSETRCNCSVIAAHGDSVLINIFYFSNASVHNHEDRFVYRASAAASDRSWARPPSLSMLPPPPVEYTPFQDATGILRRGEDDLVVAELTVEGKLRHDTLLGVVAKLLVFRSGEWGVKRAPINHGSGSGSSSSRGHDLPAPWPWETDMVVPVGDRLLCYVDLHHTTASSSSPTCSTAITPPSDTCRSPWSPRRALPRRRGRPARIPESVANRGRHRRQRRRRRRRVEVRRHLPPLLLRQPEQGPNLLRPFQPSLRHQDMDAEDRRRRQRRRHGVGDGRHGRRLRALVPRRLRGPPARPTGIPRREHG
ncbi:Os08g0328550 [Oryza sativa Japonica Group]|uniref:Os08g0328550 protein n=1 Tax=Oryza sativa subsp. japonica TaxID=39947 RepID=A0A0P0XER3_ORYSJ|nr:Os08g0328550 [Oryza sativa Japonica Group]